VDEDVAPLGLGAQQLQSKTCGSNRSLGLARSPSPYLQITSAESGRASPLSFSSLLSFFLDFWWNFRAQMRREGEGLSLYRGYPRSPAGGGGATGPLPHPWAGPSGGRPWAGRQAPVAPPNGRQGFFFISRDLIANLKKKFT